MSTQSEHNTPTLPLTDAINVPAPLVPIPENLEQCGDTYIPENFEPEIEEENNGAFYQSFSSITDFGKWKDRTITSILITLLWW
jgi:hypothetical protein